MAREQALEENRRQTHFRELMALKPRDKMLSDTTNDELIMEKKGPASSS